MSSLKLVTIVGARPQFIKAAALRRAIDTHNASQPSPSIHEVLVHTGQHYDFNMSDVFFKELGIPNPDHHLGIGGSSHGAMTGRMLEKIEEVLLAERPDWVLVFGDTNSTLAGALAAAKLHIPVAHVEAGLRSFNKTMPEEINRIVADHCSDLLLTTHAEPTAQLKKEGIPADKIHEVGDVMLDVAMHHRNEADNRIGLLNKLGVESKKYVLATVHRASNTDDPERLRQVLNGLQLISERMPVVLPLHPRTRERLKGFDLTQGQLKLIDPVGYLDMLMLESNSKVIVTDSGGVQKEAYFCQVPCLILREETEWTDLVSQGFSHLVPGDAPAIGEAFDALLSGRISWDSSLYGTGSAASSIVNALIELRKRL